MSVTTDSEITDFDRVRPHVADRRRPDQKTVAIEFHTAAIVVVMKAALNRVALANEVLPKDIGDVNVLMARVEAVQAAVRVLLQHREIRGVELHAIVVRRSKNARAEIVVGKDKAAEIGNKRLNARTHGNEIIVRINVEELHFTKRFFERGVPVNAIRAAPHVDVDDAVLARVEIIRHAERGRKLDGPIARLERSVAVKELEAELQRLGCRELFGTAEELGAYGLELL